MPFCIAPLGTHDAIIGRKWFAYFRINLAVADRKLLWPRSLPPTYFFDKLIKVSRESMAPSRIDPYAQADTKRRDHAFEQEAVQKASVALVVTDCKLLATCPPLVLKKCTLWTPTYGRHNYTDEQRRNLRNMDAMLAGTFRPTLQSTLRPPQGSPVLSAPSAKPLKADLFEISTVAYDLMRKRKDYTAFVTTLDEISSLISSRLAPEPEAPGLSASIQALDYDTDEQLLD